jgi:hypothetical protein
MSAEIIPFPSKAKPRPVPAASPDSWWEREMQDALRRVFGATNSRPCDSEPPEGAA